MARFVDSLLAFALTVLALILMVTPLLIWVAWSDVVLFVVLASGGTAGVLYCILVQFEKPDGSQCADSRSGSGPVALPDELLEELQQLHPYIHHHRPSGTPEFNTAMRHLRAHLYERSD